jgi:hypothetical protein
MSLLQIVLGGVRLRNFGVCHTRRQLRIGNSKRTRRRRAASCWRDNPASLEIALAVCSQHGRRIAGCTGLRLSYRSAENEGGDQHILQHFQMVALARVD